MPVRYLALTEQSQPTDRLEQVMNLVVISTLKRASQAVRKACKTVNGKMDGFVQHWAIQFTCGSHTLALLITWAAPQSPTKNAFIASSVLAGFAVPATWTAAAVRAKKLRDNGWREQVKVIYILWVPLACFFAYWIGGVTAQTWYGGELNATYYVTSLVYAPFSFILQWTLAGQASEPVSARTGIAQKITRIQRFVLHPFVGALSVALALTLLTLLIRLGIVDYLPVLLHQGSGSNINATITLSSLNSLVILCITVLCRLRRIVPEYLGYVHDEARTDQEIRIARVALSFGTARAALNGTLVAAVIYGAGFATSQWISELGVAPALAVYGKEGVSNLLWLLVPAINSREQIGEETARTALMRLMKR